MRHYQGLRYSLFPHRVEVLMNANLFKPREIRDWLTEAFGPEYDKWYLAAPNTYGFKTEDDMAFFILRWAQ